MFDIAKDIEATNRLLLSIIKDKEECRVALDNYNRKVTQTIAETQRILSSLEDLFVQGVEKQNLIKQFGDKAGIDREIALLVSQRNQILKETKIDTTQIEQFSAYTEKIAKFQLEITVAEQEYSVLKNLRLLPLLVPNNGISYVGLSDETTQQLTLKISEISENANHQMVMAIDLLTTNVEKRIGQAKAEIDCIQKSQEYIQAKKVWDQNKRLIEIDKRINDERIKLQKFTQLSNDFSRIYCCPVKL